MGEKVACPGSTGVEVYVAGKLVAFEAVDVRTGAARRRRRRAETGRTEGWEGRWLRRQVPWESLGAWEALGEL